MRARRSPWPPSPRRGARFAAAHRVSAAGQRVPAADGHPLGLQRLHRGGGLPGGPKTLRDGKVRHLEYGVADDVAFEVGLACGGHIELLVQRVGPEHDPEAPASPGGGDAEPFTLRTNLDNGRVEIDREAPRLELPRRDGGWFVEPFSLPLRTLIIVGAIHIAIPLHRMARIMGYRVTVIDARAKFATPERFPEADQLIVAWPDEGLAAYPSTARPPSWCSRTTPSSTCPRCNRRSRRGRLHRCHRLAQDEPEPVRRPQGGGVRRWGYRAHPRPDRPGPRGPRTPRHTALGIMAEIVATRFGGTSDPRMREKKKARAAAPRTPRQSTAITGWHANLAAAC